MRTETAHVSVPITEELLVPDESNPSSRRIDVDKLIAAAVLLGEDPYLVWEPEDKPDIRLHPIQAPPTGPI